jgi:hypothetical protein
MAAEQAARLLARCLVGRPILAAAAFEAALCEQQPTLGFRNRAFKLLRRLDPFIDHDFDVSKRLPSSRAVSAASGELRDFGDERLVFVAPVEDGLVLVVYTER